MAGRSWSHLPAWGRCWGWGVPPRTAGGAGGSTPEWKMRTGSWNLMGTGENNVTCLFIHTSWHTSPIIVFDHEDRFVLFWPVAEGKARGWIIDSFIPFCCFSFKVLVLHMLARCHGVTYLDAWTEKSFFLLWQCKKSLLWNVILFSQKIYTSKCPDWLT